MGFRFWRRKQILPGVTLNMSKSGLSVSLGVRGLNFTIPLPKLNRSKQKYRITAGIPGTGLSYTIDKKKKSQKSKEENNSIID